MDFIRDEVRHLIGFERHHKRLLMRLSFVVAATALLDALGAIAIYFLERHATGTEIHSFGNALFFATTQLLTVSSQIKNPLTPGGRVVDVLLEVWAVTAVAGSAGAIAAFFQTNDVKRP